MDESRRSDRDPVRPAGARADQSESGDELATPETGSPQEDGERELEELTEVELEHQELREEIHELSALLQTSGPIPNAQELYNYHPEHQERILRMAEASRTDESDRRDKAVDSQITISKRSQAIQTTMLFACIAAAAVSFWVFETPWGVSFLGLPVMQAIRSFLR